MTGVKVTKQFNQPWAKLRFPTAEAKEAALSIMLSTNLNGEATAPGQTIRVDSASSSAGGVAVAAAVAAEEEEAAVAVPSSKRRKLTDAGDNDGDNGGHGGGGDQGGGFDRPPVKQTAEEAVCSWFAVPYEEQLQRKRHEMEQILCDMTARLKRETGNAWPRWVRRVVENARATRTRPLACPLEAVVPSPELTGYRNKTELTIGVSHEAQLTAGFMLSTARHAAAGGGVGAGVSLVGEPTDNCLSVSTQHRAIHRDIIVPLLRQAQALAASAQLPVSCGDPWNRTLHRGLWRLATIRTTRHHDAMLVLQINPAALPDPAELARVEDFISDFVKTASDPAAHNIVSLYLQYHTGVSDAAPLDAPLKLLWGQPTIQETILDLKFEISPTSFFQVNTRATELLYTQACAWAMDTLPTTTTTPAPAAAPAPVANAAATVLDVCCGTGTIGLCVASLAAKQLHRHNQADAQAEQRPSKLEQLNVIGVEIVSDAVRDAGRNAALNNVSNIAFIAGKAEDVLKGVLKPHHGNGDAFSLTTGPGITHIPATNGEVIAIVDPPRAGLHKKVIQALRDCSRINRLVYISCNQKALAQDVVGLCRPESNSYRGPEFVPVRAIAFDLFPHTPHCELAVLFERDTHHASTTIESASPPSS
jgi:tRNA (uracil-5-)-methyltransferase